MISMIRSIKMIFVSIIYSDMSIRSQCDFCYF